MIIHPAGWFSARMFAHLSVKHLENLVDSSLMDSYFCAVFSCIFIALYGFHMFSWLRWCHLQWVENGATLLFDANYKKFYSKKSFERLPRRALSGDEIGSFLCFGGKMFSENTESTLTLLRNLQPRPEVD